MQTQSKRINIRLGDLTEPFLEQCKAEQISTTELMRKALIQYFNSTKENHNPVSFSVEKRHDFSDKKKVVVSFTETEMKALEELRKFAMKPTYQSVIVAILRAYILQEPYLNGQEIILLKDANRQLLAIGRNLNQIARVINSGEYNEKYGIDPEYLVKLANACDMHSEYFQNLINRATLRRQIKVNL